MPSRCSFSSATGPIPHSRRTGRPSSSTRSSSWRTTRMPSGLASPDAILAICLPDPAPTDATSPVTSRILARSASQNDFHVLCGGASEFGGLAERLVEGQLFEDRHSRADGVQHAAAGHAVDDAARRQHHGGGADQAAGLMHRHRRPGAVHPGLVAGAGDHAASAQPADEHRASAQRRAGQLLDRREERVHVEVQHPARSHTCRC